VGNTALYMVLEKLSIAHKVCLLYSPVHYTDNFYHPLAVLLAFNKL